MKCAQGHIIYSKECNSELLSVPLGVGLWNQHKSRASVNDSLGDMVVVLGVKGKHCLTHQDGARQNHTQ